MSATNSHTAARSPTISTVADVVGHSEYFQSVLATSTIARPYHVSSQWELSATAPPPKLSEMRRHLQHQMA